VRATRLKGADENELVQKAKRNWAAWDRDIPVLLMKQDASGKWRGTGIDPRERRLSVTYDTMSGLIFSTAPS
jgi:hypothetical protein